MVILKDTQNAVEDADKILEIIREKTIVSTDGSNIDCYVTAFAGVVAFPNDSTSYETLLKYANMSMSVALRQNSANACPFRSEMESNIKRQAELEHLVKEAIENNYFYLVYQPQYFFNEKKLHGFEALLRMKLPDGTVIGPNEFIPVAEMSEYIIFIDDYVLRRAMNEFKDIVLNHDGDLTLSVNVSAKNIGAVNFPQKIERFLNETGFPAKNLKIEITEYCMLSSVATTIKNIEELRSIGVLFALDDFGTGYSSLNYLSQLPVNLLKIDKSLIEDVETDEQKCEFVNAIISMGHLIGCEVVAEGVESEQQLKKLGENNCDIIQGYVWGKPLDYETAIELSMSDKKQTV